MASNDVHTVPWDGKWANRREGEQSAPRVFRRQRDAFAAGRSMARKTKSQHFIHRRDGSIRRVRYPHPPRG